MTKAKKLYPIAMRPGLKRDGCQFQAEYATEGDWVRWQKGMPRSMNGMITPLDPLFDAGIDHTISSMLTISSKELQPVIFFGSASKIYASIIQDRTCDRYESTTVIADNINAANVLWQSLIVPRGGIPWLLFYGCMNRQGTEITNGSTINYSRPLGTNTAEYTAELISDQLLGTAGLQDIDGGAVYASPYLFLYGSNGTVRVSRSVDPFDFRTNKDEIQAPELRAAEVSNPGDPEARKDAIAAVKNQLVLVAQEVSLTVPDKVVFGAPIRAGANVPTLLFWTLSSLVRLSNITTTNDVTPILKSDPISTTISILSPKCVVEYDGIFFWLGTDRFYVYNGNTNELPDTINIDFFYRKLDPKKAALVFGVRMPRYGEIWWFYPDIANEANPNIGCTRVLIYNKRENCWYDIELPATAGTYVPFLGKILTYGPPKSQNGALYNGASLWLQDNAARGQLSLSADRFSRVNEPIVSYFNTPYFSFAGFNPLKQQVGDDNQTMINRIEPCFISPDRQTTSINVTVNTKRYGNSSVEQTPVGTILLSSPVDNAGLDVVGRNYSTERLDMAVQGGHMSLGFSSTGLFEMGHNLVLLSVGDGNR